MRLAPATPEDVKLRDLFIARVEAWPTDTSTAEHLLNDLNRLLGNVWFSFPQVHQRVFDAIEAFGTTVRQIGGMTMNERLFSFGLLELWDASSEEARTAIRLKLRAA